MVFLHKIQKEFAKKQKVDQKAFTIELDFDKISQTLAFVSECKLLETATTLTRWAKFIRAQVPATFPTNALRTVTPPQYHRVPALLCFSGDAVGG